MRKNGRFAAWVEQPIASQTLGQALRHIVRNEGFVALYAGLGPTFAMAVPARQPAAVVVEIVREWMQFQTYFGPELQIQLAIDCSPEPTPSG